MVDLTAQGQGYYRVYLDYEQVSQHLQEREAAERAVELKVAHPGSDVRYRHDYEVVATLEDAPAPPAESDPTPDPPDEPDPEPDPEPEPDPTPEPEPPSSGDMPVIARRSFDTLIEDGWSNYTGGGRFEAVGGVGRMVYPAGMGSRRPAGTTTNALPRTRESEVRFSFRVSSNWWGHKTWMNKIGFVTDGSGGGGDPVVFMLAGKEDGGLKMELHRQSGSLSPGQIKMYPNVGSGAIIRGQWHEIRYALRHQTANDRADGRVDGWIDGQHFMRHHDVQWNSVGDRLWQAVKWEPIYGGQGDDGPPHEQVMEMGYIEVRGA